MGIEGSAPTTTHSGGRHANATPITKEWSRTSKAAKNAEPNAAVPTNEATTNEATTYEATTEPRTASPAPKPTVTVDMQIVERFRPTVSVTVDGTEPTTATCQHPNSHITRNVGVTCARNLARGLGAKLV